MACCPCFEVVVVVVVVVPSIDCVAFSRRVSRVCLKRFSSFDVDVFFLGLVT